MGAISFIEQGEGRSAEEVFGILVSEATFRHGNDGYNGTINTCSLGKKRLSFEKFKKGNLTKANKFIEKDSNGRKWVADYIDLGVIRYEVYTFKKKHTGNNPKYKMQYSVKGNLNSTPIKSFQTKKEADDYALKLAIKNPEGYYKVEKEYVLVEGNSTTTVIEKETKVYQTKPKLKPMPNRVIVPIHKFMFYGWASI